MGSPPTEIMPPSWPAMPGWIWTCARWCYLKNLPGLVRAGKVSEARLNDAVRRVLRIKFALGLFESPYADPDASQAVHLVARVACHHAHGWPPSSMVLLKNNGILPLRSDNVDPLPERAAGRPAPGTARLLDSRRAGRRGDNAERGTSPADWGRKPGFTIVNCGMMPLNWRVQVM